MAGPRQGHVEQAEVLAAPFLEFHLLVLGEAVPFESDVDGAPVGVVPDRGTSARARSCCAGRPVPHVGAEHDRELEALAAVDVITCTASASDSSRRARSSFSLSRAASWMRRPSQVAMAVGPRPSDTPASCSNWAMWRRSVMNRSPDGRAKHPLGHLVRAADRLVERGHALSRSSAAQRCSDQCSPSHSASSAVATPSGLHPTKQVSAASEARSRAVGRSSAWRSRSHSSAGSVAKTEPAPPITAGTPAARERVAHGHGLAVRPHQDGNVARVHRRAVRPRRRRDPGDELGCVGQQLDHLGRQVPRDEASWRRATWAAAAVGQRDQAVVGVDHADPQRHVALASDEPLVADWRRPPDFRRRCRRSPSWASSKRAS